MALKDTRSYMNRSICLSSEKIILKVRPIKAEPSLDEKSKVDIKELLVRTTPIGELSLIIKRTSSPE